MTIIGYWRTSASEQDGERQVRALKEAACQKIYGDQMVGSTLYGERQTPELSRCIAGLKDSDLFICEDLGKLGRSMVEILVRVNDLIERGAYLKTLDGRLDTSLMPDEIVRMIVSVMGYVAEMELKNIKSKAFEGRLIAQSRGVKFGRKRTYDESQIAKIMEKRIQGQGYGTIAKELGMSRSMVQRIVQKQNLEAA